MSRATASALRAMTVMSWVQVALGISTLVYLVPTPLAASHQAGSLLLLSTALWLMQTLYSASPAGRIGMSVSAAAVFLFSVDE